MNAVTLYEVAAREVMLGDAFTISRQPGAGPRCSLGTGLVLLGVDQQPLGHVWLVGEGQYAAMSSELRTLLEAPILAAAQREIEMGRVELLRELAAGPWWARVWRALRCAPSAGPHTAAPA